MWPKTDAQRTLLATAQAIAEQIASTAPAHDRDASFPFEHFEAMRAAGYLGAAVPREFGGGGHGLDDLVLAQLAIARGDGRLPNLYRSQGRPFAFTNPIWVALLAPGLLSEKLTRPRVAAAALGFLGVLIVARPGSAPLGPGQAAALLAATGFAMNTIYTKQIMRFDSVLCVLFWMTLAQSCFSLALALPGGIPLPSPGLVPWILVVGLTGLTAHYALTSALSWAPASVVAPMEFIRLPVLATLGMLVYGEPFDPVVFLGAGAIVLGNLVNLRGERARTAA